MQESTAVKEAMLVFYDRLSANDVGMFDSIISSSPATTVVGTAPGEVVSDREQLKFGFETEGVTLKPNNPRGYEEGTMGWFLDEPMFGFPDGSSMKTRLTTVMILEDGKWKLVHGHFSVGVPDEEVVDLQKKWGVQ